MLKRVTALFLLLCFGFFSLEALVADVCDGDAPAAEVMRLSADAEAHPELASVVEAASQGGDTAIPFAPASPSAPDTPSHDVHACHCAHTHASVSAALMAPTWRLATGDDAPRTGATSPASAERQGNLRPPIA